MFLKNKGELEKAERLFINDPKPDLGNASVGKRSYFIRVKLLRGFIFMKKTTNILKTMVEIGVFAAIGFILDAFAHLYSSPLFINGGSIGLSLFCVFFMSYRRGTWAGVLTGFIISLLDFMDGFYVIASTWYVALLQILLDYVLSHPVAGLAGLFKRISEKNKRNKVFWIALGCIFGGLLKFTIHFLSGLLFWNDPSGFLWGISNGYLYSLLYNGSYMLPNIILNTSLIAMISIKWPFLFSSKVPSVKRSNLPAQRYSIDKIKGSFLIFYGFIAFIFFSYIYMDLSIKSYTFDGFGYSLAYGDKDYLVMAISSIFVIGIGIGNLWFFYHGRKDKYTWLYLFILGLTLMIYFIIRLFVSISDLDIIRSYLCVILSLLFLSCLSLRLHIKQIH